MSQGARASLISCLVLVWMVGGSNVPRVQAQCFGDCDGNGAVSAAEIADGTEIALLTAAPESCPAYGEDVAVDALVTAVNVKIDGCPPTPSPTPSATPTTTSTPLATNTPGGVSNAVAGGAAVVAKSLGGIPSLVTAIVTGLTRGGSTAALDEGGGAGACPLGGSASRTCTPTGGSAVRLELGLDDCALSTPDGSLALDTVFPITLDTTAGLCPSIFLPPINATADLRGTYRNTEDAITLNTRATLTAIVQTLTIPNPAPVCVVSSAQFVVTGALTSALPAGAGGAVLNFFQTTVDLDIETYNNDCVPVEYTLTFNGPAKVNDTSTNEIADVTFVDLVVQVDARNSPTTLVMDGGLNFACIAGAITLDTISPLTAIPGALCPTGGTLAIGTPEGPARIRYNAEGTVDIDIDDNGVFDNMFSSCIDPMLLLCPQS